MSDSDIEPLPLGGNCYSDNPFIQERTPGSPIITSHLEENHAFTCEQKGNCNKCCIEGWIEGGCKSESCCHGKTTKLLSRTNKLAGSSSGSLEDIGQFNMKCPVNGPATPTEDDSSSLHSNQPLINDKRELICQSPSDDRKFVVRGHVSPPSGNISSLDVSVRCPCHTKVVDHTTRKAVIKLVLASLIAILFMIGEVIGGYFSNSLAIMTDAAHMLSDFAGFLISLFAIWVSKRPPSRGMSFGWHRAEVIGAIVSVLIIWVLTGVLLYEAVKRVIHRDFEVNADYMLVTACVGVFVNVFMCMVLHQHSHGHGGHGHSHGGGGHGHSRRGANRSQQVLEVGREGEREGRSQRRKKRKSAENINVRAAFIHVIGDLIQSIGVVIAGYVIWFKPEWKLADPICTFFFCLLVLFSTVNVLKDALRVVMEGTPKHLDYEEVKGDLCSVEGVMQAHSLHIWSLTLNRTALSAHLVLKLGANSDAVLAQASLMLKEKHYITQSTLQVEGYQVTMDECGTCQEPERLGALHALIPSFLIRKQISVSSS